MATRYSGNAQIRISYSDARCNYRVRVLNRGIPVWSGVVNPPAVLTRPVDSAGAYDDVARAALAFAEHDGAAVEPCYTADGAAYDIARRKDDPARWRNVKGVRS